MRYAMLVCGLFGAMSALAEPGIGKALPDFRALDTDGDKMISLPEAQQGAPDLAEHFNELDANHDGLLSREELAHRPVRITRHMKDDFAAADTNADGMLTRVEAEHMPIVSDLFDEMDTNGDGLVALEEIQAHAKAHGPIRKRVMVDHGAPGAGE